MKPKKTIPKTVVAPTPPAVERNFLLRKIPAYYSALLLILFAAFVVYVKCLNAKQPAHFAADKNISPLASNIAPPASNCYKLFREFDYTYTHPLVFFEREEESAELNNIKLDVSRLVDDMIHEKKILSASIYVSNLGNDKWFCVNPEGKYQPTSLIKLPVLMIYLKESEKDPGVLERKITFEKSKEPIPNQTFKTKSLIPGNSYTVKELLSYMIIYSDNNATHLLNKSLDVEAFQYLFTSIGMEKPIMNDRNFIMSVFDYSKFFHILYNSTFLSHTNSNYALSLLAQCEFKDGMVSGLPAGITIAHKFGESADLKKGILGLHESGIAYTEKGPILITIFTTGEDVKALPGAIARITQRIYNDMQAVL